MSIVLPAVAKAIKLPLQTYLTDHQYYNYFRNHLINSHMPSTTMHAYARYVMWVTMSLIGWG